MAASRERWIGIAGVRWLPSVKVISQAGTLFAGFLIGVITTTSRSAAVAKIGYMRPPGCDGTNPGQSRHIYLGVWWLSIFIGAAVPA